jgi:hypothetical protein
MFSSYGKKDEDINDSERIHNYIGFNLLFFIMFMIVKVK